jgi:hypothetical protein
MRTRGQRSDERGAILIVGLLVCLILLAIGALVIDVPRMERVGRMLQRAADAAALAGAAELNAPDCVTARQASPPDATQLAALQQCWQRAKRSAFYALQQNPVYTTDGVEILLLASELDARVSPSGQQRDLFDLVGSPGFDAEQYEFPHPGGVLRVQITRMVYTQTQQKFSLERPNGAVGIPIVERGPVVDGSGLCDPVLSGGRCNSTHFAYRWANGMHIRLRVTGFPSILAQLPAVGIPASSEIERSGFAAPHHSGTDWDGP